MNELQRLERTIARQEDTIFRQTASIVRLLAEIDRLAAIEPRTAAAVAALKAAADERASLVQSMRQQGKSIAKTAQATGLSARTVSRLRKRD